MKTLKNLFSTAIATLLLLAYDPHLLAQSFCTYIGDGLSSTRYQSITEMIPMEDDLAFAAWNGHYSDDMETFVGRVSTSGNLIWSKSLNLIAPNHEKASALLKTQNGNLIVASNGSNEFSLAKVAGGNGNLIGAKHYPHPYEIEEIFELPNGNIAAFGTSHATNTVCVLQFDANLEFLNGTNTGIRCQLRRLVRSGANFYGVGIHLSGSDFEGVVFQLNSSLIPVWISNIPGANGNHILNSIALTSGGNLILGGLEGNCTEGLQSHLHYFMSNGQYLATKAISHPYECISVQDLKSLPNGNLLLTGTTNSPTGKVLTMALDQDGAIIQAYESTYGIGRRLAFSSTNLVFVAGDGEKYVSQLGWVTEGFLTRLNSQGSSCCSDPYECTITDLILPTYNQPQPTPSPISIYGINQGQGEVFGEGNFICPNQAARLAKAVTEISIFPNPANSEVHITIPEENGATLQLFELKGQLIMEKKLPQGTETITVDELGSGLYMLRIHSGNHVSSHRLAIAR